MDATFRSGGLASGLDSNSIIDKLVQLESRPISVLRARQAALRSQVSIIGDLASKLSALADAAKALADGGVLAVKAVTTNAGFSVTPGAGATAGRYEVAVDSLASAAKARSQAFASGQAPVRGGTLHLDVKGVGYDVSITDGQSLADVARTINQSGAPVSAVVLSDGTSSYLSITNRDTGYAIGGSPQSALTLSEISTGTLGQPLSATIVHEATNASFTVDGLAFTRTSNTVTDAIPGVSLGLKNASGVAEDVVLENDTDSTQQKLQSFVDAYNQVYGVIQKQVAVDKTTNRASTLAGDATIRVLQRRLQQLVSTPAGGLSSVRTLADLGIKSARDGSLSINETTLAAALNRDPAAVDAVFAQAGTGLGVLTDELVQGQVDSVDGVLTTRTKGLNETISQMDSQAERLQARVDAYRDNLVRQYAAMEQIVSALQAASNFLNAQSAATSTGGSK